MIQALTQMLAQKQAQTVEIIGGLQHDLQEAMQGMMADMKGEGKGTMAISFNQDSAL